MSKRNLIITIWTTTPSKTRRLPPARPPQSTPTVWPSTENEMITQLYRDNASWTREEMCSSQGVCWQPTATRGVFYMMNRDAVNTSRRKLVNRDWWTESKLKPRNKTNRPSVDEHFVKCDSLLIANTKRHIVPKGGNGTVCRPGKWHNVAKGVAEWQVQHR